MRKLNFLLIAVLSIVVVGCGRTASKEGSGVNEQTKSVAAQNAGEVAIIPTLLNVSEIPKEIHYKGKVKNAVKWSDALGVNIVITTETGVYPTPKYEDIEDVYLGDADLFAYRFRELNGRFQPIWQFQDSIRECVASIDVKFIDNTFQITDLDHNGVAEVWLMYKRDCRGDVSPRDMKIVMYEGAEKYEINGTSKVKMYSTYVEENGKGKLVGGEYVGGEYTIDKAFANGSVEFLEFAKKLWNTNIMETWD